jgi:hypothetical protein
LSCSGNDGYWHSTFLQQDAFQKRVFVTQHQTLVGGMAMGSLKVGQILLMSPDGFLELLDVLGPALSESRLSLTVPLFSLLGSCIDLAAALAHADERLAQCTQS